MNLFRLVTVVNVKKDFRDRMNNFFFRAFSSPDHLQQSTNNWWGGGGDFTGLREVLDDPSGTENYF